MKQTALAWRHANTAAAREKSRRWRAENRAAVSDYNRQWAAANPARRGALQQAWHAANPGYNAAACGRRKAVRLRATPSWADASVTAALYAVAAIYRRHGVNAQVDHVVPLQSKTVCGLHVPANLTLRLAPENASKGNRWWPDMPLAGEGT